MVYSIPKRQGLNDDDAADITQQTFLALYKNLDRIDEPQTLPRWLAVTASREGYRFLRVRERTTASEDLDTIIADEESRADALAEQASLALIVRKGIARLGEKCRKLLTMLYLDDKPYKEVSETLEIPMGAIGPSRTRCLEKLRKDLESAGIA